MAYVLGRRKNVAVERGGVIMDSRTRKRVIQALGVAIDTAESWIDAERTQPRLMHGNFVGNTVPTENRHNVARYTRDIVAWRRARRELQREG